MHAITPQMRPVTATCWGWPGPAHAKHVRFPDVSACHWPGAAAHHTACGPVRRSVYHPDPLAGRPQVFSFKVRGAFNFLASLTPEARAGGVICASAGNHAQGVAMAARHLVRAPWRTSRWAGAARGRAWACGRRDMRCPASSACAQSRAAALTVSCRHPVHAPLSPMLTPDAPGRCRRRALQGALLDIMHHLRHEPPRRSHAHHGRP